jgi:hypothetical protein
MEKVVIKYINGHNKEIHQIIVFDKNHEQLAMKKIARLVIKYDNATVEFLRGDK